MLIHAKQPGRQDRDVLIHSQSWHCPQTLTEVDSCLIIQWHMHREKAISLVKTMSCPVYLRRTGLWHHRLIFYKELATLTSGLRHRHVGARVKVVQPMGSQVKTQMSSIVSLPQLPLQVKTAAKGMERMPGQHSNP